MPTAQAADGTELFWEERGDGPAVVITPHAWALPELFEPLAEDLARDHRVVLYDARGTGRSSRVGPHDMDTGAEDLVAVVKDARAAPAVVVGLIDSANRAIRIAASRPDLVRGVVSLAAPVGRKEIEGMDALVGSAAVIDAIIDMAAKDYRGALRPLLTAANEQMTEEEQRERMDRQIEHIPQDVAVERLRAWADDTAVEPARAMGDRLWLLNSPQTAGPWFPRPEVLEEVLAELLPEARRAMISDGIVSRPEETAAVVRRITGRFVRR
jgi:pimeloyl-ACP methyl ester carboxylesterase